MMNADALRLAAALLVAAIHTGPLGSVDATVDLLLCRVLARLAVPYFWLLSGHFVLAKGRAAVRRQAGRLLLLYAAASAAYLPASLYAGYWTGPAAALRRVLLGGTFTHLWYLPATAFGLVLAALLGRYLGRRGALAAGGALYLAGLWANAWYPLAARLPGVQTAADAVLSVLGGSRNGLFFAPLFLLLGAWWAQCPRAAARLPRWGLALALPAMAAEALWLRGLGPQPNDSMYLLLPLCAICLVPWVRLAPPRPALRRLAGAAYLCHPYAIIAVRGLARLAGLRPLLVENSVVHYLAVCTLTLAVCAPWAFAPRPCPTARAWAELDGAALANNAAVLRAALPPGCRLLPAVKANAYGHGAVPVARALRRQGVEGFCVACAAEGVVLRRAGIGGEILILGYTAPAEFPLLRRWRLTQAVVDAPYAAALATYGRRLAVHIKVDTGMHRLGLPCGDIDAIARVFGYKTLKVSGIFTHLCTDDTTAPADMAFARRQIAAFEDVCAALAARGIPCPPRHLQSSTGILRHPGLGCEAARPGIALYGLLSDSAATARWGAGLRPVLALRCRVAAVHALPAGAGAGYGLAYRAKGAAVLAVLTIGYADGVPRALSCGVGVVLLHGQRAPIAGRICMDQLLADVTDIPGVQPGDIATLIGRDGGGEITACEVAEAAGTISNELLSRLGARLERVWV